MTAMLGYSLRVIQAVDADNSGRLEIKLARHCIKRNIPVTTIATQFGVTRQTVYNWFCNGVSASAGTRARIETYLARVPDGA